ncbi:MAG: PQQ-binding-like beta-propeller repeat protein, partial [Halobaculum sp.]
SYVPEAKRRPRERWRRKLDGFVREVVPTDNGIVVSTAAGSLVALLGESRAGATAWTADNDHAGSPPVKAGTWVYSAGGDSLSSVRTYDQNVHWRVDGEFGNTGPVAAGDTLYVSVGDGVLAYDLDGGLGGGAARFGARRWSHRLESGVVQGLAVGDGALFVACEAPERDDRALYRLDPA